jgi:hypothetical protein
VSFQLDRTSVDHDETATKTRSIDMHATISNLTARRTLRAALAPHHNAAQGQLISAVDDFVFARRSVAYASDQHGVYANPSAPLRVRGAMALLAELMRLRDGVPPRWARRCGEQPRS